MATEASLLVTAANVQKAYIAYFGRPADAAGLSFWDGAGETTTMVDVMNDFAKSPEFAATYPNSSNLYALVNGIYRNLFGHDADSLGAAFWVKSLQDQDISVGEVAYQIARGAQGTDLTALNNKVTFATQFTDALIANPGAAAAYNGSAIATVRTQLAAINTDVQALAAVAGLAAQIATLAAGSAPVTDFSLTANLDRLVGTAGADTFNALVVQNSLGEQTNQLATGDQINGGGGTDSLDANVQMASPLNSGPQQAITPITVDLEKVYFTALSSNNTTSNNNNRNRPGTNLDTDETVIINAKDMLGLDLVGSVQSDASLLIENLTTLTDTGVYASRRNTETMTVRMDHSGNDRAVDAQSDMTVLFDNDYLLSGMASKSSIELRAVNALSLADATKPLKAVTNVQFSAGGKSISVPVTAAIQDTVGPAAYDSLVTAIIAKLADLNVTGVSVTALTQRSVYFSDDVGIYRANQLAGQYKPILITASDDTLKKGQTSIDQTAGDFNGFYTQNDALVSADKLIEVQVQLDKVGRGAEGGELIIGGMSTDLQNNWNYSAHSLEEGVERFRVTVEGDQTQLSSLSGLHSTNNTLQEVIVKWEPGSLADLYIGNHNTEFNRTAVDPTVDEADIVDLATFENSALKDVRLFDATATNQNTAGTIKTDVSLNARITVESIAKYLQLTDSQADPIAEDVSFKYDFGAGNDSINLHLGSEMANATQFGQRADFDLSISTGAGNDNVVVQIGLGDSFPNGGASPAAAWYVNNNIEDNLSIVTGDGNDVIRANAGGSWIIDAGANNDAIYSDNSGRARGEFNEGRSVWLFNNRSTFTDVDNLVGADPATTGTARANVSLTVNYFGLTKQVLVGTTHTNLGGIVTDLVINQAIKEAINTDTYLSRLLVAEDTASGVLIVRSLTDGFTDTYVPTILVTSTPPTQAQIDNSVVDWAAAGTLATGAFEIATESTPNLVVLNGEDSVVGTQNNITAGAGLDVVVLSTSGYDVETVNVSDGAADVVFNATRATITLDANDKVVSGNGYIYSASSGTWTIRTIGQAAGDVELTGSAGADLIVGTTAVEVINGAGGNDTITGGAGADDLTGGTGADTFVFANGSSPITGFDVIRGFATASDVIDYTVAITIQAAPTAAVATVASISAVGVATFNAADDTTAERIIAAEAGIQAGTATAGQAVLFQGGNGDTGNAYLLISDGVDFISANDVLIQLVGVDTTTPAFDAITLSVGNVTLS